MFVRTSRDSESQDATKITSALADSRNYSLMKMMTLYICLAATTIFLSGSPSFSPSVVTMSTSRPTAVCRINRWTKKSAKDLITQAFFFTRNHESKHMVPGGDSFHTSRLSVAQVTIWLGQAGRQ